MLRRYAGPGITFLLGTGWSVTGWESESAGIALMVGAVVWAIALLPPVRSIRLERGGPGDGFAIRFAPPAIFRKRRLKQDTLKLVGEIREYGSTHLDPWMSDSPKRQASMIAFAKGDGDEAMRLWQELQAEHTQAYLRETQLLAERFGGRISYAAAEFRRRGLLTDAEVSKIEWQAQSAGWIQQAANRLEGLVYQL